MTDSFLTRLKSAREAATDCERLDFDDFEHEFYPEPTGGEHTRSCPGCKDFDEAESRRANLTELLVNNAAKIEKLIEAVGPRAQMHAGCACRGCKIEAALRALDEDSPGD